MKHIKTTIAKLMATAHKAHEKRVKPEYEAKFLDIPDINVDVEQYRTNPKEFYSDYAFTLHGRADWQGVHPEIRQFSYHYYTALKKQEIPIYAHTVLRSRSEQLQLFHEGFSKLRDGPHLRGCAIDFVHQNRHWKVSDNLWQHMGKIGKEIIRAHNLNIEWGGDFKTLFDPAHWQLKTWRQYPHVLPATPVRLTPIGAYREAGGR